MAEPSDGESIERGPQKHLCPASENMRTGEIVEHAIRVFAPSGSRADILALFQNRASFSAIQHWRKGRREPPQWAVDLLQTRAAPIMRLKAGVGPGRALIAWLKANGRYPAKEKAAG
jgi:hypothetical protein